MFGKKSSIPGIKILFLFKVLFFVWCFKEQAKAHTRELRKTDRELVRDRHKLEAEEQRIVKIDIVFFFLK